MEVRPYGPTAWFADDVDDPIAWVAELRSRQVAGVIEIIPAEHTVVVVCERDRHGDIGSVVAGIEGSPGAVGSLGHQSIEVVYDGPDLLTTADALGLSMDELIRRHASATYTVAFWTKNFACIVARYPMKAAPGPSVLQRRSSSISHDLSGLGSRSPHGLA